MDIVRLFRVLVVGGALIGGASCEGDGGEPPAADAPPGPDSAGGGIDATAAGDDAASSLDGAAPQDCFCDSMHDLCCNGTELREGFTCCWSTTC